MNCTQNTLDKLNKLIKVKFNEISDTIGLLPADIKEQTVVIEKAWHCYCMSAGIIMNIIPDYDTETREDLPQPGGAMRLPDGTFRIRNIWGDKYIDIPEETALRALVLGFLP